MRRWAIAALAVVAVLAVTIGIGFLNARAKPVERRVTVRIAGFPTSDAGLSIALLSDMHLGNAGMTAERLTSIATSVSAARPDLILIAGDFVIGHDASGAESRAAALTAPLSHLHAALGVFAVLGNHDHWTAPDAIRLALERAGVKVLDNQAVHVGPLTLIGIDDRFSQHDDIPRALAQAHGLGGLPVVLTHSPDLVSVLPAALPLVLAGHTHCGQVVLPWWGPLVTRGPQEHWRQLYEPRYRCGLVRDPHRLTIVTAGLGSGTMPIRLGAMPDWWLVTLR